MFQVLFWMMSDSTVSLATCFFGQYWIVSGQPGRDGREQGGGAAVGRGVRGRQEA